MGSLVSYISHSCHNFTFTPSQVGEKTTMFDMDTRKVIRRGKGKLPRNVASGIIMELNDGYTWIPHCHI